MTKQELEQRLQTLVAMVTSTADEATANTSLDSDQWLARAKTEALTSIDRLEQELEKVKAPMTVGDYEQLTAMLKDARDTCARTVAVAKRKLAAARCAAFRDKLRADSKLNAVPDLSDVIKQAIFDLVVDKVWAYAEGDFDIILNEFPALDQLVAKAVVLARADKGGGGQ